MNCSKNPFKTGFIILLTQIKQFYLKDAVNNSYLKSPAMKNLSKIPVLLIGLLITFSTFGNYNGNTPGIRLYPVISAFAFIKINEISRIETMNRLKQKALQAKEYVKDNRLDARYCFLLDMRLPSGKNRFFVYNLEKDSVEIAGLVAHGKGSEKGTDALTFSNTPNSKCTSLGKYKLGKSYTGIFGLAYKLYGMEESNSEAFARSVVLHSYTGVPENEVYPAPICVSEGCPTVARDFLTQVKIYMDESHAPILLWIYY